MRTILAGLLSLIIPGTGHALVGRRKAALAFAAPVLVLVFVVVALLMKGGPTALLAAAVTPGVLPAIAVVNILLAAWRILAGFDAVRGAPRTTPVIGGLVVATLVLVVVPHLVAGRLIASTNDFLDAMFAPETGAASPSPLASLAPGESYDPYSAWWENDVPPAWYTEGATEPPASTGTGGSCGSGAGSLPALGASVPWTRPGATPWGDDGRFDLLLLGSDAGACRWSRRMDVMLLVEVDVASGKVAMVGLPRNLFDAPFPPGAARDAVACGCFQDLLNALYVEATVRHPDRWPGAGITSGIGAVRAVVSEITGRPIDAVLVADLIGVVRVVDAMNGIDINVPSAVHDDHYPDPILGSIVLDIPAGQQHMDGRTALAYSRSRHQDSDYQRMARQQTMLLAIRNQIGPATILGAPDLFAAAKGTAWTDLPRDSLPALVTLFDKASHTAVKQLRIVPPTYPSYVTAAELTKIRKDVAALLGGVPAPTPTPIPSPSPSPSPVPSDTPPPSPSVEPTLAPSDSPTPAP